MGRIILAGSINMDIVARTAHHPQPGETVFGQALHYIPGGKGSNQAVGASRLSDRVCFVGKLGRDPFGDSLTAFLKGERLNLDHLSYSDDQPTGIALITVSDTSENTIVVVSGSNYALSEADVNDVEIAAGDVVVSVFEIPQATIKALFTRAKQVGATTILNPAPAAPFTEGLLALTDYVIVNETELAFFAGQERVTDAITEIEAYAGKMRATPDQTVIVTLGAKGVVCVSAQATLHIEGVQVNAVDTTGAGDCFTGALAVGLLEGMPLRQAAQFANQAASLSVQRLGASVSMPYRDELQRG